MIRIENVSKVYRSRKRQVVALDAVNLPVDEGEFVAIKGPSGSGKSTLLLTIGGMIRPTKGRVMVGNTDVYAMSGRERAKFRAEKIGFVFQMFHLVPYLTVLENALLPVATSAGRAGRKEVCELLERFGLSDRMSHKPGELSTGERQRAAMARALLNRPGIVLADEPTGNLDPGSAAQVMDYLAEYHHAGGTVVLVTHEEVAEGRADRTVSIRRGSVEVPPGQDMGIPGAQMPRPDSRIVRGERNHENEQH